MHRHDSQRQLLSIHYYVPTPSILPQNCLRIPFVPLTYSLSQWSRGSIFSSGARGSLQREEGKEVLACSFRSWMGRGLKGSWVRDWVTHRLSRFAILALVALSTVLALPS